MIDTVGLDAALFIRFAKMCRNIFLILSVIGCGVLIPVNLLGGKQLRDSYKGIQFPATITPQYTFGNWYWAFVVCAYLFDIIICIFLWTNYRAVLRLRRAYFDSPEYQQSLHARTLLITDIPKNLRSDDGIVTVINNIKGQSYPAQPAIARDVRELTDLVDTHDKTVRELETVLAKYLKNPDKLPSTRPTRKNKGTEVDAIDFLTSRIKQLEATIHNARLSVGTRNAMPYGFATYNLIARAHDVASNARGKGPHNTTVRLAAKPTDLIWRNLAMSRSDRRRKNLTSNFWVGVLTILWIAPNILIAVFLSNLSNLGLVWPAFNTSLKAHKTWWSIVQGVVAPALTTLFYFYLPAIFRKLCVRAGDVTKTSRERHVMHKLYAFFMVNNLIVFSIFSAIWGFVAGVVKSNKQQDVWGNIKSNHPFQRVIDSFNSVSPYWMAWLLQRNLGAAVDLAQLFTLTWGSISRRWFSPTPREMIELSAPQPFDYAGYYNYFLFYATVAMFFATLQPLVLPVTAFYFCIDTFMKKYLLMYIFITKVESGGAFWPVLFNRFLALTFLGNVIIALTVVAKGNETNWAMLGCLAPLPFLILAFKWYCNKAFGDKMRYYSKGSPADMEKETDEHHGKGARSGNPVLYRPLITPMVLAKAQHLLKDIYHGRTTDDDTASAAGYSDIYLNDMDHKRPGKMDSPAPYEIVKEGELDFEYFKSRPEFGGEYGGNGELFGRPQDISRPNTPGSMMTGPYQRRDSSPATPASRRGGSPNGSPSVPQYEAYRSPRLQHSPMSPETYDQARFASRGDSPTRAGLLQGAQAMGQSPPTSPMRRPVARPSPQGYHTVGLPAPSNYDDYRR